MMNTKKTPKKIQVNEIAPCSPVDSFKTDATVHPALKSYFGYCFVKAALKYKFMLSMELDSFGVVSPQLGMLKLLHVLGPVSQIQLGQEMGIDKASMVKFLDGLEKKKWIQRMTDKKDRRIKLVGVTAKGLEAIKKLKDVQQKVVKEFLAPLSKSEQELLKDLVSRLT